MYSHLLCLKNQAAHSHSHRERNRSLFSLDLVHVHFTIMTMRSIFIWNYALRSPAEQGGPPALFIVGATVMEFGSSTLTFLYLYPNIRWTWHFHCWGKLMYTRGFLYYVSILSHDLSVRDVSSQRHATLFVACLNLIAFFFAKLGVFAHHSRCSAHLLISPLHAGMSASNVLAVSLLAHFAFASTASHNLEKYIRFFLVFSGVCLCSVRQYYCYLNCFASSSYDEGREVAEKQSGSKID